LTIYKNLSNSHSCVTHEVLVNY